MDVIPTVRFVASLIIFGLLISVYNPIVEYLRTMFSVTGEFAPVIFFLYFSLPAINLFVSGFKLIMEMQTRKRGYY